MEYKGPVGFADPFKPISKPVSFSLTQVRRMEYKGPVGFSDPFKPISKLFLSHTGAPHGVQGPHWVCQPAQAN